VVQLEMPAPDALLREAEEEPNYRDLNQYCPVIATLLGKGFSYREIAEWLSERGVELDHNSVYRLHTRNMPDLEAKMEDQEADLEAQLRGRSFGNLRPNGVGLRREGKLERGSGPVIRRGPKPPCVIFDDRAAD